ncbi:hypothetical protein Ocin01_07582 [Orchesella cincta]|uniref:Uncharacterized protein n=1 Tax=Orchesella cincta TaxID=48709 RepID=A0A1D2N1D2_ORCCI|nr:hypothetical protein Ocin01_07582 [Orchesella cincta]
MKYSQLFHIFGIANMIVSVIGLAVYFLVLFELVKIGVDDISNFHNLEENPLFHDCVKKLKETEAKYTDRFFLGICLGVGALVGFTIVGTSFFSFSIQKDQTLKFVITLIIHVCSWSLQMIALFLFIFSDKCIFDHQRSEKYTGGSWQHAINRDLTAIILVGYRPYEVFLLLKAMGCFKKEVKKIRIIVPPTPNVLETTPTPQNTKPYTLSQTPSARSLATTTTTSTSTLDTDSEKASNAFFTDHDYAHLTQLNDATKRRTLYASESAASVATTTTETSKHRRKRKTQSSAQHDTSKKKSKKLKN